MAVDVTARKQPYLKLWPQLAELTQETQQELATTMVNAMALSGMYTSF